MVLRSLICTFLLLCAWQAPAQNSFTISGTLQDSDTSEPLVYATIGIKGQSISTVTNSLGEFDFHIPANHRQGIIVVSMMGYENREYPAAELLNASTIFLTLNKATKYLDEIIITDSLSGADITRIAVFRIEQNFPMEPFLLDGFYRDLKKIGGSYFSLLEAAVKIYDEDYVNPKNKRRLRERVGLTAVRKSLGYDSKFTRFFEQDNLLESLLLKNDVRYHSFPDAESDFYEDFKRVKITYYNEHRVYVVERNTPNRFTRIYVDTDSYAIIRIEEEELFPNTIVKKRRKAVSKYISEKKIVDFKEYQESMYVNYMTMESKINWYNEKTGELKFETEIIQELLINQVFANTDQRINNTQKMRRYGLQYQQEGYNKEFWGNYNVIKDTPLNAEIVADLEKQGALDVQFEVEYTP